MTTVREVIAPRPARPAQRYFAKKAPKGVDATALDRDSDDEDDEENDEPQDIPIDEEEGDEDLVIDGRTGAVAGRGAKGMNIALRKVEITDGRVIVDGRLESGRTKVEEEEVSSEDDVKPGLPRPHMSDESGSEYETESEEEEEEVVKPVIMFRPVFVPKRGRETIQEMEAEALNSEEAMKKREQEAEERRKQSHAMVAETIKRELAEKEAPELIPDVDDTDGLDPTAEFEAWRLRELARIKRDKEDELAREKEREEIERRRAMPEEQRLREDLERAKKTRDEKPKGQQKFLQKYWHKGAFHQDEEILTRHDFTEATESTVDISYLPKVMQVKNFGKRSQTKYTHLLDQDTTVAAGGFGGVGTKGKGKGGDGAKEGCWNCGGPHLRQDCPIAKKEGPSGVNSGPLGGVPNRWGGGAGGSWRDRDEAPRGGGERGFRPEQRERGWDDRGPEKKERRPDDRGWRRSRSRSMSISPPRNRSPPRRRSRERSDDYLSRDRDREKRRRLG